MSSSTDTILVALFLGGMALFGLIALAVVLRVGPRRGHWNQPAAALARPGRGMRIGLLSVAVLHVVAGVVCAAAVPGGGAAVLVVLCATGCFYALCATAPTLAVSVSDRRRADRR